MTELIGHSAAIARRHLLQVARQPWLVAINLVQPFLWLLLFSATFHSITDLPGFAEENYAQFFLPGLIVMTALLASSWNGLTLLGDMERGTLDRLLASPVRRPALIVGPLAQQVVSGLIPTAILLAIGYGLGARFHGGLVGALAALWALSAISAAFAALSHAVAMLVRREESLIAMVNFIVMPLSFLSTAFMPANLVPDWVATGVAVNPVNWAVEACRAGFDGSLGGAVVLRLGLLTALAVVSVVIAQHGLRRYCRTT
ncbi:ABC-2 type transport system permease protein [Asanoa hainanensis]|uniref:Transport permease protein n=1 Tax=Asanoa hainanensis TaxID=560556 RepID=A0A239N2U3_9ACTN|nr:ABC transporter permease [Asanoa hainanensis]SNT48489.1 ABC-2 type transport system permease protein [Asanoa hainanensis]